MTWFLLHHNNAQHHAGAPSALFQLVQLLVKRGDIVDARTTQFYENNGYKEVRKRFVKHLS
ncbi:acyltransferase [Klebsiella pneumoniae]|nr:acyltransferase [Klebsiella pneumoniae]STS23533.1 acyltransferase [Klebsiella pneumoniae]